MDPARRGGALRDHMRGARLSDAVAAVSCRLLAGLYRGEREAAMRAVVSCAMGGSTRFGGKSTLRSPCVPQFGCDLGRVLATDGHEREVGARRAAPQMGMMLCLIMRRHR